MSRFTSTIGLLLVAVPLCFAASEPLDQWLWRNPLPSGDVSGLMAITFADGTFAAVGSGGAVVSSTDGTNWVGRTFGPIYGVGTNYSLAALTWGDGSWVAVGEGYDPGMKEDFPVILTSPDLTTWTPQAVPDGGVGGLSGVAYANGLFVAVGAGSDPVLQQGFGAILTSPDGVHWTLQNSGTTDFFLEKVIYGNGLFVVGSFIGNVLTSPDGVNWTFVPDPITPEFPLGELDGLWGLTYASGLYLVVGGFGIRTSTDAANWTNRVSAVGGQAITSGNGLVVAISSDGQLQTSTDGLRWTRRGAIGAGGVEDLAYGNGEFVAVGNGTLGVSTNGFNWTNLVTAVTTTILEGVAYGQGTFVAAGQGGTILSSTNGAQWSVTTLDQAGAYFVGPVGYGGGSFVVLSSQGTILLSTNGFDWLTATNTGGSALTDVTYGNGQFVVVGTGGVVLTSTNGSAWAVQDSGVTLDLLGLTYGDDLFVASTGSGVLTSPDGMAWAECDFNLPDANAVGLGYGNGLYVAVGDWGLILTSTNAVDWTTNQSGTSAHLSRVSYGDGTFLVTGDAGTLLSSTNGTDWVSRDAGTLLSLRAVAFGQDTFVVVGDSGSILQSGVLPPFGPRLSPTPGWTNGAFGLTLLAPMGGKWDLQGSTNLLDWTTLGTITATNSQMLFMDTGAADSRLRFYRAVRR